MDNIRHNKLTQWNWVVGNPSKFKVGKNVDIGAFTYINARYGVIIEDDVQIGGGCHIYSHNTINNTKGKVILKKGCKIGAHTVILPRTTVKRGTLIRVGSILKGGVYNGKRKTILE